ncbi:tetratricopeptide repeat protein [Streptomyces sp. ODS28]|uniref:ATP-binding protein n=1 Tax=Streptomyces sp. ODS28 TaxID=3136688 RepID=UPI0031EE824A
MPESDVAAELLSAMTDCGTDADRGTDEPVAWRELGGIVAPLAAADPAVAEAWDALSGTRREPAQLGRLAEVLAQKAAADPSVATELRRWARLHGTGGTLPADDAARQSSVIGGAARVHGPVVQARDITGGVHLHAATRPDRPVPRQLPPERGHFVNREEDECALDRLRAGRPAGAPQLLVVSGTAGVGKTALVARWLRAHAEEFPDGQLYADLGAHAAAGPVEPGDVLEQFLRALGADTVPGALPERAALWRSLTSDLRVALMLDDAFTAAQVRPLLPASPHSLVVAVGRSHLTGLLVDGAALHQLDVLAPDAAVELLARGGGGDRVGRDLGAARDVVALCACLPLAVCLAAAQLAVHPRQPVAQLAGALSHGPGPLEALRSEGEAGVRAALDESYRLLPPVEAAVYRRLGVLPSPEYDLDMAAAAGGVPPGETVLAVRSLVEANLLEETGRGTYRFHDLVRAHAGQRALAEDSEGERQETVRRFADWCLHTATAAESLLSPSHRTLPRTYAEPPEPGTGFEDSAAALSWLKTHRDALMGALRHSAEAGWDSTCWQLADAMWPLFLRLRPADLWVEAHELGLAAARRAGDRAGENRMLTSGGAGLRNAGRHTEAAEWYAQALRHAEEDGGAREQAQALNGLGNAHLRTGRLDAAESAFSRALALRESIGYVRGAALSRVCLGETAQARGDEEAAVAFFTRARAELLKEGDAYDAARALALLGQARSDGGDPAGGAAHLRQALEDFRALGSRHWEARALEMLGRAAWQSGDQDAARDSYAQALALYRQFSPADAERLDERLGGF